MALSPGELTIRPEHHDDHAVIAEVVAAAFGSSAEAALVTAIRGSVYALPELALVAEVDGAGVVEHGA